jgi:hypothetical protein
VLERACVPDAARVVAAVRNLLGDESSVNGKPLADAR